MAGNIVVINGAEKDFEWYISDSNMPELLETLNRIGFVWDEKTQDYVDFQTIISPQMREKILCDLRTAVNKRRLKLGKEIHNGKVSQKTSGD